MEKYLLLKLGMNVSEVEKVLEQKITLEQSKNKPDSKGFFYLNDTIGTYLHFKEHKILDSISFFYPFSLAVDGIKISMNMKEVEKIKGLPETKESKDEYIPENEKWFYYSTNTCYLFINKYVFEIILKNQNENIITKEKNMEKYLLLKLGMNVSEVEKVLEQKITLERYTHSPDSKNLFYVDYTIGTHLLFTEDKILKSISFRYPFSVAVDGIKIGMNMNEVEKIKGEPEENVIYDNYSEMVEWHYYSKNVTYLFIDNKVYEIYFYNFDESYLTKDDIDTLVNAVSDFDKIDTSYFEKLIENGDVVISSSFDNDKSDEKKYYDK